MCRDEDDEVAADDDERSGGIATLFPIAKLGIMGTGLEEKDYIITVLRTLIYRRKFHK